ncbi:MAG TPA: galactose-1-phosphate uridylyltransferase, partial [bacterium]|nr:galactose-1-phosphate uridylyltransferase [bacterium]
MPELRKDPIVSRWVIISTERSKRPTDLAKPEEKQ